MEHVELNEPQPAFPSPSHLSGSLRTSCDQCRRAKIKCERRDLQSICAHCIARGTSCITTPVHKKPPTKKVTRQENILGIESRIARMESLLVSSGLDTSNFPDSDDSRSSSKQEDLSARLTTLIVDDESGSSHFWGPSSGLSIFSPQGLQWVADRTGVDELQGFIAELAKSRSPDIATRVTNLWIPTPSNRRIPFPPREVAERYIRRFFGSLNSVVPLFDQKAFMELYEQQYSATPPSGPGWYASLNIVLAIGSLTAALGDRDATPESATDELGNQAEQWVFDQFFKNACSVFTELLFTTHSLLAVQALLGISFVLESTLNVQASYIIIAAAARLAHTIGLHRRIISPQNYGLSPDASKQRRNVFWILYILENSMAIRFGRPPIINDDDIDLPMPENGEYFEDSSIEDDKLDTFYHQVTLSRIESKIYTELYSVKSQRRTVGERLKSIAHLDQKLQAWRDELPPKIRPGQPLSCPPNQVAQAILLHFIYYNCITTLHRAPSHCALWAMNPSANSNINGPDVEAHHRVYASHMHCINAARSTGQLLGYFDQQERLPRGVLIRLGIFYPLSAFLTLFANILQNPKDSYVEADNRLMNIIADFFSIGLVNRHDTPLELAGKVFQKLSSITTTFLAKTSSQKPGTKRGYDNAEDESSTSAHINETPSTFVGYDDSIPAQPAAISDDMRFHAYGDGNVQPSVSPHPSVQTYDPANPSFGDANLPPPMPPFISPDLGNIEWDGSLFF